MGPGRLVYRMNPRRHGGGTVELRATQTAAVSLGEGPGVPRAAAKGTPWNRGQGHRGAPGEAAARRHPQGREREPSFEDGLRAQAVLDPCSVGTARRWVTVAGG